MNSKRYELGETQARMSVIVVVCEMLEGDERLRYGWLTGCVECCVSLAEVRAGRRQREAGR